MSYHFARTDFLLLPLYCLLVTQLGLYEQNNLKTLVKNAPDFCSVPIMESCEVHIHAFAMGTNSSTVHVTPLPIVVPAVDVLDVVLKRETAKVQLEKVVRSRRVCLRQVVVNGSARVEASVPILFRILFLNNRTQNSFPSLYPKILESFSNVLNVQFLFYTKNINIIQVECCDRSAFRGIYYTRMTLITAFPGIIALGSGFWVLVCPGRCGKNR